MHISSQTNAMYAIALVLSLLTISLYSFLEEYTPIGPQILKNEHFENDLNFWVKVGNNISFDLKHYKDVVLIDTSKTGTTSRIFQQHNADQLPQQLLFTAHIKTASIKPGAKGWQKARIILVAMDSSGKAIWNTPHTLTAIDGTTPWKRYSASFTKHPKAASYQVRAEINQTTGRIWIDKLSLRKAELSNTFAILKFGLIIGWFMFFTYFLITFINTPKGEKTLLSALIPGVIILTGTLIPMNASINLKTYPLINYLFTNFSGHLASFMILSFIIFLFHTHKLYQTFLALVIFAAISEILQLFVTSRATNISDLFDFFVDCIGITFGFVAVYLFNRLRNSSIYK